VAVNLIDDDRLYVKSAVVTVLRLTNLDRVLRVHATVVDASRDW
jgi:hypothetical protein